METKTYKMLDLVGTSPESIEAAIQAGLARAGETMRNMDWFEIKEARGTVKNGKVGEYQVRFQVGFRLE